MEFLDSLSSSGLISQDESQQLVAKFKGDQLSLLLHLKNNGSKGSLVDKAKLGKLWADSGGFSFVDLDKTIFQSAALNKISSEFARKNKIIPLYQIGEALTVASADPSNKAILQSAEKASGLQISPVFSFPDEIDDAITVQYQTSSTLVEINNSIAKLFDGDLKTVSSKELNEIAGNKGVVELVDGLLLLCLKEKASDIHIEPFEDQVRIRFRIDGVLQEKLILEKSILLPIVTRLKIMANRDITERRRPQDGRVKIELASQSADFRFSTIPTIHGEKIVLRAVGRLNKNNDFQLESLNLSSRNLKIIKNLIKFPNGVLFVTGPTGSGKTTTLYSILMELNQPGINSATVEDPVECPLPGINQLQVNPAIDLNFAEALRSFLRQDPDVIFIGEVRDLETARIASQAALTGHLVMATMHTNNSYQAITRLVEIGVEPFLVAPSVIGVLAQRLVRKICSSCKKSYPLTPEEIENIFIWDGKREVLFYKGSGCEECNHTGYSGRIAIHEIFILNEKIREMIANNSSILEIQKQAIQIGFQSLRYDGIKKVLQGLTTMDEVNRITGEGMDLSY
jgi:type IV pilus assembly protein PilB